MKKTCVISYLMIGILLFIQMSMMPVNVNATETGDKTSAFAGCIEDPKISAKQVILVDADTGNILYEKDAFEKAYPASTTKMVTALLALENNVQMDDTITMSYDSIWNIDREGSNIALDVGEQISVEDCLYAVMLPSANEAAYALAEHVGGSLDNFVSMMNDKAEQIGCVNTHFTNANGLHDKDHYTCAYDLALFCKEASNYATYRKLSSTYTYSIQPTNLQPETRYLYHTLGMLDPNSSYAYPYLVGGKTGSTTEAGFVLVTTAEKDGKRLIAVVMGCPTREASFSDTISLYNYGYNNFTNIYPMQDLNEITSSGDDYISENYWKNTDLRAMSITYDENYSLYVPANVTSADIDRDILVYDTITNEGVMGDMCFYYQDVLIGSTPITYSDLSMLEQVQTMDETVYYPFVRDKDRVNIFKKYWWGVALAVIFALLILYLIIKNIVDTVATKKNRKSRKNFEKKGRRKY